MTSALSCPDAETALGALVLGALDPGEREQVEAHVRTCPACAAALGEIAPLPGLLMRSGLAPAELEPAPDRILQGALARVRAEQAQRSQEAEQAEQAVLSEQAHQVEQVEQVAAAGPGAASASVTPLRRRRLPLLAAAAAVIAALLLGGGWWAARDRVPETVTAMASSAATGVAASVVMTPTDEGTSLALTLSGVTPGERCSLVAVGADGTTEVTSTWVANYEGEATISGSTGLTLADITRFDITTPNGQTLLQVPVPA